MQAGKQTDREANRQTGRQAGRQTDRQAVKQVDRRAWKERYSRHIDWYGGDRGRVNEKRRQIYGGVCVLRAVFLIRV